MTAIPVAALQLGSSPAGTAATLERILVQEATIAASGARLVVMPEALLGGYPKGETFDTYLGYRLPAGRERYAAYHAAAIERDGPEVRALAGLSRRTGASLVVGAIERDGATLYCSALFIDPEAGLVAVHRKLMPTASERLVWGHGDGSTLAVVDTAAGRAGAAICWENHMPLLRMAMYAKGVQIWCAPTVDEREIWQCSMRHIAHEGRCFVISAAQYQPSPAELGIDCPPGWSPERPLMRGGLADRRPARGGTGRPVVRPGRPGQRSHRLRQPGRCPLRPGRGRSLRAPGRVPPGSGRTAPAPGGLPRLTAWPHWLSVRP